MPSTYPNSFKPCTKALRGELFSFVAVKTVIRWTSRRGVSARHERPRDRRARNPGDEVEPPQCSPKAWNEASALSSLGSEAGIAARPHHVCFTPESGHQVSAL